MMYFAEYIKHITIQGGKVLKGPSEQILFKKKILM